ncbi:MAG TPA: hypothetical protein DIT48_00720 [Actinobacteria bacterium]|nr:hypothetical protein [Actinomycetota bacterium]
MAVVMVCSVLLSGCHRGPSSAARVPPPPPTPSQNLGPGEPPVVWIGGILQKVSAGALTVHGAAGSTLTVRRLKGATSFFHVSNDRWVRLDAGSPVHPGQTVCVETLLDQPTLVALRVFLGAGCGPD